MVDAVDVPLSVCDVASADVLGRLEKLRAFSQTYNGREPNPEAAEVLTANWRSLRQDIADLRLCLPEHVRGAIAEFDRDVANALNVMIRQGPSPKMSRNATQAFKLLGDGFKEILDEASPD